MNETKVYVDELPESCWDCFCQDSENGRCKILGKYVDYVPKDCPLVDVKTHDRELVAKVFEKIKSKFNYYELVDEIKEEIDFDKMKNYILDQIQKGV